MTRVLVTGADGFIGRTLCPFLRRTGYAVAAAVRHGDINSETDHSNDLSLAPQNVVTVGEIGSETDWRPALEDVNVVIHLAARTHVLRETAPDPLTEFRRVNVLATENLANTAVESGVGRMVFVSSIHVHGSHSGNRPLEESDQPRPHTPYAQSKWEAEQLLRRVAAESGLEVVIVRPPLVYGAGVKGNFLRLLNWVSGGLPLPLSGVRNRRSFVYVDNLADLLEHCIRHPRAAGENFLASDGQDLSTPELIGQLATYMEQRARLVYLPPAVLGLVARFTGFSQQWNQLSGSLEVNARKNRALLGRSEPVSLDDGLARTVRWYVEATKKP